MTPDFADPHAMLAVPRHAALTAAQTSGAACVWCSDPAPVALGPRLSTHEGTLRRWEPRACHPCTRREADRVHRLHTRTCPRCRSHEYCPEAKALHTLSQAASATSRTGPVAG
jgi:hypothetical protein